MKAEIDEFKQYISHRYPGGSTTKHYMSDLAIFQNFVGDVPPQEINIKMVDRFVQSQSEQGLKPATINRRLSALSSFFEYLIIESENGHWQNPVHWRRHSVRPGHHLPRDASDQTVETLLEVIVDTRDRAMVMLMLGAGLRLSEVRNLRLEDCDLVGKRLRIRSGKGNRDRVIPMTDQLATILQAYLLVREPDPYQHFLVYRKASVKGHLIPDRLKRWGLKASIQPMTPHRLRHTLATMLINQGMPIVSLQKFLGHQDINKTMIYARVHDKTVKEQFATAMTHIERIPIANWPSQVLELESSTEQTFDSV